MDVTSDLDHAHLVEQHRWRILPFVQRQLEYLRRGEGVHMMVDLIVVGKSHQCADLDCEQIRYECPTDLVNGLWAGVRCGGRYRIPHENDRLRNALPIGPRHSAGD